MGDYSRNTFDPKKHYNAVLQQQGRVMVDADWNEQQAIQQHRTETEARDVIGLSGAPVDGGGFRLELLHFGAQNPEPENDLWIREGRFYVDGILCEHEVSEEAILVDLSDSPDVIVPATTPGGHTFRKGQWLVVVNPGPNPPESRRIDSYLCEIVDTSDVTPGRVKLHLYWASGEESGNHWGQNNWKIRYTYLSQPSYPDPFILPSTGGHVYLVYLDVWRREITPLDDPLIREVALGGPDTAIRLKTIWQVKLRQVPNPNNLPLTGIRCDDARVEMAWREIIEQPSGKMSARTVPQREPETSCQLPPGAGYQGLENQLYRIEIHQGGERDTARFKWSRDNATVVTSFEPDGARSLVVADLGKDEVLGFNTGNWVEILDEEIELKKGEQGFRESILARITGIDKDRKKLTLDRDVPQLGGKPWKLKRWDQGGDSDTGISLVGELPDGWTHLENGIQVKFEEKGTYRDGDYWLIPARTATGDIEWPPYQSPGADPLPQPPLGIKHSYARLALVDWNGKSFSEVRDCRKLFSPLADGDPAIHIKSVRYRSGVRTPDLINDRQITVTELLNEITIECDREINENSVKDKTPVCFISVYIPILHNNLHNKLKVGFYPVVLNLNLRLDNGVNIILAPLSNLKLSLTDFLNKQITDSQPDKLLAKLTVKGNSIWAANDPAVYLDGEVFGRGASERSTYWTEVKLPSGDKRRGGDFEMWFWLISDTGQRDITDVTFVRGGRRGNSRDMRYELQPSIIPDFGLSSVILSQRIPEKIQIQFSEATDLGAIRDNVRLTYQQSDSEQPVPIVISDITVSGEDPTVVDLSLPTAKKLAPGKYTVTLGDEIRSSKYGDPDKPFSFSFTINPATS